MQEQTRSPLVSIQHRLKSIRKPGEKAVYFSTIRTSPAPSWPGRPGGGSPISSRPRRVSDANRHYGFFLTPTPRSLHGAAAHASLHRFHETRAAHDRRRTLEGRQIVAKSGSALDQAPAMSATVSTAIMVDQRLSLTGA